MPAQPLSDSDDDSVAARVAAAERRADARLACAIDDIFLPAADRLDERTRVAVANLLEATVAALERDIAGAAARLLGARDRPEAAARLASNGTTVLARLSEAGVLRDVALMTELVAQARIDLIDERLLANRAPGAVATLLARLTGSGDGNVRQRAVAYMIADGRRRLPMAERRAELPAALQRRLAWWVAAALRERFGTRSDPAIDRCIVEAAQRSIDSYDADDRVETTSLQLAAAIDATPHEQPFVMHDALAEGRMALFVAVLAQALGVAAAEARALAVDEQGDRLWLALRALGWDRDAIARVGWALCEADPARDVELLADAVDAVAGLAADDAAAGVAAMTLDRDFRDAMRALARTGTGTAP